MPTVTFRVLYCSIVLRHNRREIVHFNVTANPNAQWTAQQITGAFPYDEAPKYLIRDRDEIYGKDFCRRVKAMSIKEVIIAPQARDIIKCCGWNFFWLNKETASRTILTFSSTQPPKPDSSER